MLFRRSRKEETPDIEPEAAEPRPSVQDPAAVLRDESGLYHLWYFERRLMHELARAARTEGVLSLLAWQLRLLPGEAPDSEHLHQCASLITKSLRPYDILARIDEQRFVALVFDADYTEASTVAYRIKGELQLRAPSAGKWQAGVATLARDGMDGESLIQAMLFRLEGDDALTEAA